MAKNRIEQKTQRAAVDPVTHETTVTVLDAVQLAFERCTQFVEGRLVGLSNADAHRVAAKLRVWLDAHVPHTDAGGVPVPLVPPERRVNT